MPVAIAVSIAVLCAILAWMLLGNPQTPELKDRDNSSKKEARVRPQPAARRQIAEVAAATNAVAKAAEKPAGTNEVVLVPGQMTLPDGRVLRFPVPREGEYRMVHSHGKTYRCDHLGNWTDVTPKPVFDNSFEENLIGLSMDGGHFIPGMLMGLDPKGVKEMLKRKVVVNPDDPEDVVAKKQAVADAKEIILDYIEKGGTMDQFVAEMRDLTVQERKIKSAAMKDIIGFLKEGRVEEAARYRRTLDEQLAKAGVSPVKLPAHIVEILGQVSEPGETAKEERE